MSFCKGSNVAGALYYGSRRIVKAYFGKIKIFYREVHVSIRVTAYGALATPNASGGFAGISANVLGVSAEVISGNGERTGLAEEVAVLSETGKVSANLSMIYSGRLTASLYVNGKREAYITTTKSCCLETISNIKGGDTLAVVARATYH